MRKRRSSGLLVKADSAALHSHSCPHPPLSQAGRPLPFAMARYARAGADVRHKRLYVPELIKEKSQPKIFLRAFASPHTMCQALAASGQWVGLTHGRTIICPASESIGRTAAPDPLPDPGGTRGGTTGDAEASRALPFRKSVRGIAAAVRCPAQHSEAQSTASTKRLIGLLVQLPSVPSIRQAFDTLAARPRCPHRSGRSA